MTFSEVEIVDSVRRSQDDRPGPGTETGGNLLLRPDQGRNLLQGAQGDRTEESGAGNSFRSVLTRYIQSTYVRTVVSNYNCTYIYLL